MTKSYTKCPKDNAYDFRGTATFEVQDEINVAFVGGMIYLCDGNQQGC